MNKFTGIVIIAAGLSLMIMIKTTKAEVFTALSEMEELLETEAELINNLESYIAAYEEKLRFLKQ